MWKIMRENDNKKLEAYFNSGHTLRKNGRIVQAIDKYAKALKLARKLNDDKREADAHICLGNCYFLRNQLQTAIDCYQKALGIAEKRQDTQQKANAYFGLGRAYRLNNQFQTTIENYENALEIAKQLGDQRKETEAYLGFGHACASNDQYPTAITHFEKALEIANKQGNKQQQTKAYIGLGDAHASNNQFQSAIECYEEVFAIAAKREDKRREAEAYLGLGRVDSLSNQFQTAIGYYEKALEIAKKKKDKQNETEAYLGLGQVYKLDNQFELAIECYKRASDIAKKRGDKRRETQGYLGLGEVYLANNQFDSAIGNYRKASTIAIKQGDKRSETEAYVGFGHIFMLKNQFKMAIEFNEKALGTAQAQGYKLLETKAYLGLGRACRLNNQFQTAVQHCEEALKVTKKCEDKQHETEAYLELGHAYTENNQSQTAIGYYTKALEIARERADKRGETEAYLGFGHAYIMSSQFDLAIQYFSKVLRVAEEEGNKKLEAKACLGFGDAYRLNNQFSNAIKYYYRALEIAEKQGHKLQETEAYLGCGHVYRMNEFQTATEYYYKALKSAQKLGNKQQEGEAYLGFGHAYILNNQSEAANKFYEKVLEIANERRDICQEAEAYIGLGRAYSLNGYFQMAIEYYTKALEIAEVRQDKLQKTEAYLGLGRAYSLNSQSQMAFGCCETALEMAKERGDKFQETEACLELGYAYTRKYHFQTAIEYFEKVLEISETQGNKRQQTKAYLGLGDVYILCNQSKKAIEYYEIVLESAKDLRDAYQHTVTDRCFEDASSLDSESYHQTDIDNYEKALELKNAQKREQEWAETRSYIGLGHAYRLNNQHRMAIEYYEKALDIAKERRDTLQETEAYLGLGHVFTSNNQHQMAIENYENALEIALERDDMQQETDAYLGLGEVFRFKTQYQTAIEYFEKALEFAKKESDKKRETMAYLRLGEVYRLNSQHQTAIEYFMKALEIANEQEDKKLQIKLNLGLCEVFSMTQKNDTAMKCFEKALNLAENEGFEELKREVLAFKPAYSTQAKKNSRWQEGLTSQERSEVIESRESWNWKEISIIHREKFIELLIYGQKHPNDVKDINGVRVCCSADFCIGLGALGSRVYVGLSKDGAERAVKRLPKDCCTLLAKHEMRVLTERKAIDSSNVIKYWFLDDESDQENLYLVFDLCEETLKNYVDRESLDRLLTSGPIIIWQILKGLVDLHRDPNPILHRDLKPSNILRDVHGRWLLSDFGVSRILESDEAAYESEQVGTTQWRAVETYPSEDTSYGGKVRYKKASDIQVAGMVAYYIVTKGQHPFGEGYERLRNILNGKPVGLDKLEDYTLKDFLSWMLSHEPKDRPTAEQALKHPYLQTKEQQFELLCNMGNQPEIKTGDVNSNVVRHLNSDSTDWRTLMDADVLNYLCCFFFNGVERRFRYGSSWTECLRLVRNVNQHWRDRPGPKPLPEALVKDDLQEYFLKVFPNLPAVVHRIVRSSDWQDRPDLQKYFKKKGRHHEARLSKEKSKKSAKQEEEADQKYREEQTMRNILWNTTSNETSKEYYEGDIADVSLSDDDEAEQYFDDAVHIFDDQDQSVTTFTLEEEEKAIGSAEKPVTSSQKETDTETKKKHEEISEDEKRIWFKNTFLNSKFKLKEEIHKKLRSFSWLSGAYGLACSNEMIRRPHLYLTVKTGMKKEDVQCQLTDKFMCDAKEYFEILQKPRENPKIKYLALGRRNLLRTNAGSEASVSSVQPLAPGFGVLACTRVPDNESGSSSSHQISSQVPELPDVQGAGTLTMFCSPKSKHYALTCFHVGCATDLDRLNAAFNKIDIEKILDIRESISTYKKLAEQRQYYFTEPKVSNDNEPPAPGDDDSNYTFFGKFVNCCFNSECDILSVKIFGEQESEINCKIPDVTFPDWDNIHEELYERVYDVTGRSVPVKVGKIGYCSGLTEGHIVPYNFSYSSEKKPLFQDAFLVKGCSGTFLEGGDSGALVFFHDKESRKQVFAYGVCEIDKVLLPNFLSEDLPCSVDDDKVELESGYKGEAEDVKTKKEYKGENHNKNQSAFEDKAKFKKGNEHEIRNKDKYVEGNEFSGVTLEDGADFGCEDVNEYEDTDEDEDCGDKDNIQSEEDNRSDDESDDGIVFQTESESNVSIKIEKKEITCKKKRSATGPYFICLRLETALEKLTFYDTGCFDQCGSE